MPLDLILLNLLDAVWSRAFSSEIPEACSHAFADDTGAPASGSDGPRVSQRVLDLSCACARLTGQQLHGGKSNRWSTTRGMRDKIAQLKLNDKCLTAVDHISCLGVQLNYACHPVGNTVARQALEEACTVAARIRWLHFGRHARAQIVGTLVNLRSARLL